MSVSRSNLLGGPVQKLGWDKGTKEDSCAIQRCLGHISKGIFDNQEQKKGILTQIMPLTLQLPLFTSFKSMGMCPLDIRDNSYSSQYRNMVDDYEW